MQHKSPLLEGDGFRHKNTGNFSGKFAVFCLCKNITAQKSITSIIWLIF